MMTATVTPILVTTTAHRQQLRTWTDDGLNLDTSGRRLSTAPPWFGRRPRWGNNSRSFVAFA